MRSRKLFKEAFKAGYKKALRQMHKLNEAVSSQDQEVIDTFVAAVHEADEEGVDDVHGIIDYWQQVYADDVLYGYNAKPMNIGRLAGLCTKALRQTGILPKTDASGMLNTRLEIAKILQSYVDLRNDFESRF